MGSWQPVGLPVGGLCFYDPTRLRVRVPAGGLDLSKTHPWGPMSQPKEGLEGSEFYILVLWPSRSFSSAYNTYCTVYGGVSWYACGREVGIGMVFVYSHLQNRLRPFAQKKLWAQTTSPIFGAGARAPLSAYVLWSTVLEGFTVQTPIPLQPLKPNLAITIE